MRKVFDLGIVDFEEAFEFQKRLHEQVRSGLLESAVILCRHHPVITLGRSARKENINVPLSVLSAKGIAVTGANRGGDVTYHGPGQLIVYPIINLNVFQRDIHLFLRKLEEFALTVLREFGVAAGLRGGLTGVWAGNDKIASIGIAVKNWISLHGLAINIQESDLANFYFIRPCGMDIKMTSLESVLKSGLSMEEVTAIVKRRLEYGQGNFA
jgi:lipoate-protein ligase B